LCRNNIGNWPTHAEKMGPGVPHDRHYYGVKDLAMAKDASFGFMIWDGTSKGTLTNVINLLGAQKKVLLYQPLTEKAFLHYAYDWRPPSRPRRKRSQECGRLFGLAAKEVNRIRSTRIAFRS
jgi:hypothetical protein